MEITMTSTQTRTRVGVAMPERLATRPGSVVGRGTRSSALTTGYIRGDQGTGLSFAGSGVRVDHVAPSTPVCDVVPTLGRPPV